MNSLSALGLVLVLFSITLNLHTLINVHRIIVAALLGIQEAIEALKGGEQECQGKKR